MVTKSGSTRVWFDINDVVREVLALARTELHKHDVKIVTELSTEVPRVHGDRVQLMQVVLNLIMNGVEAMSTAEDPRELTVTSRLSPQEGVHISVADTGSGVDAAKVDRVFDSFFTTKATGMGMGLSICRSIIGAHAGRIWLEPNAPHGASSNSRYPLVPRRTPEALPSSGRNRRMSWLGLRKSRQRHRERYRQRQLKLHHLLHSSLLA
jgi:signal transduction histidine kinase